MPTRIAILGSTGSIGTQALEVVRSHPAEFEVELLTAGNNVALLIVQALEFRPNAVVIQNEDLYDQAAEALQSEGIKVFAGDQSVTDLMEMETIDLVLVALVGFAGLRPTLKAVESGKRIALANKETLVVGGHLVDRAVKERSVPILPVDSEHSAIFQCLTGEHPDHVEKLLLTASGGPFRGMDKEALRHVTPAQALVHPNWKMGVKVTIDSASLMNKGLEMIEAHWLFGLPPSKIDVLIHPQSVIHSLVQFKDGSVKAQMGIPDMKLPILYALSYPERLTTTYPRLLLEEYKTLSFEKPDFESFPNLSLAYHAIEKGGNAPCVLNAANEIAIQGFVKNKIGFLEIPSLIEQSLQLVPLIKHPGLEDLIHTDHETRVITHQLMNT